MATKIIYENTTYYSNMWKNRNYISFANDNVDVQSIEVIVPNDVTLLPGKDYIIKVTEQEIQIYWVYDNVTYPLSDLLSNLDHFEIQYAKLQKGGGDSTFAYSSIQPSEIHSLTKINRVEPTCTASGNIEYYVCTICGLFFEDEDATTVVSVDDILIPPLGHNPGQYSRASSPAAVSPTCLDEGYHYEKRNCTRCGIELDNKKVIDAALGHLEKTDEIYKVEATCVDKAKSVKLTSCSRCGTFLSIAEENGNINPNNHLWATNKVVTDITGCQVKKSKICARCGTMTDEESNPLTTVQVVKDARIDLNNNGLTLSGHTVKVISCGGTSTFTSSVGVTDCNGGNTGESGSGTHGGGPRPKDPTLDSGSDDSDDAITGLTEDFSRCTKADGPEITELLNEYTTNPGWSGVKVSEDLHRVKLGSSRMQGFIITPVISVSSNSVLTITASNYGTSVNKLTVSIKGIRDSQWQTLETDFNLTEEENTYTVSIPESYEIVKIKLMSTLRRFYLSSVTINNASVSVSQDYSALLNGKL